MENDAVRVTDVVSPWANYYRHPDGRIELRLPATVQGHIEAPGVILEFSDYEQAQAFASAVNGWAHEVWRGRNRDERFARIEEYANRVNCLHLRRSHHKGHRTTWRCEDCGHEGGKP